MMDRGPRMPTPARRRLGRPTRFCSGRTKLWSCLRVLAFAAVSVAAPPMLSAQDGVPHVDPYVLQATSLVLHMTSSESGWGGFEGPTELIICTDDGGTLYVLAEPPKHSYEFVSLPSDGPASLYYSSARPARLKDQCFHIHYRFEGRPILSFPQLDSIYTVAEPATALTMALIHEEFHRFQEKVFAPTTSPDNRFASALDWTEQPPDTLIASTTFGRLAAEERRLLAEAIETSDRAGVLQLIRQYITLRTRRLNLVAEDLRANEAHEERKEGTAHLVSYEVVANLLGKPGSWVPEHVRSDLLSTPSFDQNPGALRHWHIYATGAGIGLIMDKLGVAWRRKVQEGQTLFDCLQAIEPWVSSSVPEIRPDSASECEYGRATLSCSRAFIEGNV